MADLKRTVKELVDAATSEVDPKALRSKVEAVLAAFDDTKDDKPRQDAVKTIGTAIGKVEGRGAQVLALALGALVEGGASATAAWPAASKGLAAILEQATAFAHACVAASGEEDLEVALEKSGAAVAAKMPKQGAAWKAVPARCLAAVACLARSKDARNAARKAGELEDASWSLSDAVAEVGALHQALRVLDDATIVVRNGKKETKLTVSGLSANAELYVAIAKLLAKEGKPSKKKTVKLPFTLGIDPDDLPIDLPLEGKVRVVVLGKGETTIDLSHLPVLDGLEPQITTQGAKLIKRPSA
jgi:hypothetical protein